MKKFYILCFAVCLCVCSAQENIFTLRLLNEEVLQHLDKAQYRKAIAKGDKAYTSAKKLLGEEHIETLAMGNNLALAYDYSGLVRKAETLYLHLLEMKQRVYGKEHPTTLLAVNNLGSFYQDMGDPRKALSMLQSAYKLQCKTIGAKHRDTLTTMQNLAALYNDLSLFKKSQALHQKCYTMMRDTLGENHSDTLNEQANFAFIYLKMGQYTKAKKMLMDVWQKRIRTLGRDHPTSLNIESNIASLYRELGEYRRAEKMYQRITQLLVQKLGENHPSTLISYSNIAVCYQDQGRYSESEKLIRRVLDTQKIYVGKSHITTMNSMNNLASIYEEQGKFAKARELYSESLHTTQQVYGEVNIKTFVGHNNLASVFFKQGHETQAQQMYTNNLEKCRQHLGELHPVTIGTANNLLHLYLSQGDLLAHADFVVDTYNKAKKVWGIQHPSTIKIGTGVAWLYTQTGKNQQAEKLYIYLLKSIKNLLGKEHPTTLVIERGLADTYTTNGKPELAQKMYRKILGKIQKIFGEQHPQTLLAMNNLASNYARTGHYSEAMDLYDDCLKRTHMFVRRAFEGSNEQTKLALLGKYNIIKDGSLKFYLSLLTDPHTPKNIRIEVQNKIFEISLLYKSLALFSSAEVHKRASKNPKHHTDLQLLNTKRNQLSKLFLKSPLNHEKYKQRIDKVTQEISQLEQRLTNKISIFHTYKYVSAQQIQQRLRPQEALVDFVIFSASTTPYILATIVKNDDIVVLPISQFDDLRRNVKEFREKIVLRQPISKVANVIYCHIWQPLEHHLSQIKTVYLISENILHLLPFNALIDNREKYLIENFAIHPLTMARDLLQEGQYPAAKKITIFSAPDFGNVGKNHNARAAVNLQFEKLPFTQVEAQSIAQIADDCNKQAQIFSGSTATKQQILTVKSPQILHIATHGFFLNSRNEGQANQRGFIKPQTSSVPDILQDNTIVKNPLLQCGLAFSNANMGSEGVVTALEVLSMNLTSTQLVVLSACETGVGTLQQGEEVYSLRRAFQQAGAGAVLSTLWILDDKATNHFMRTFYRNFFYGLAPQQSLRKTQLAFLRSDKYQHPYFWAPFVMNGYDKRFPQQSNEQIHSSGNQTLFIVLAGFIAAIFLVVIIVLHLKNAQKKLQQQRQNRRQQRLSKRS
ncbi:CHAT domain-containing protein [Candidatus Uabimicrobium amorphum]|uniref:CHAT domain-containing protein n=1 Tax=Uabimicrobium amorphum TaxID=2596890 RepID=A0A5S9ISU5_UABAM|nr:CHAT domain-containing tetratricopeptide repeat protein [Candidatus Uabimicrobium amorphum]BBM86510.1 hypothetical protein UABAM_04896 [Candidatus Uabimicrobium amorphum]